MKIYNRSGIGQMILPDAAFLWQIMIYMTYNDMFIKYKMICNKMSKLPKYCEKCKYILKNKFDLYII